MSTSVKTTPNALVVAGVAVPGTKKCTSVTGEPTGEKSFCGEKVWKAGLPKRTGVAPPLFALTVNPVPGVPNSTPRALNMPAGKGLGSLAASGTPSQLISRRTPPNEPLAPAVAPPPTSARKRSRAAVMSAGVAPAAVRLTPAAPAWPGTRAPASAAIVRQNGRERRMPQ